ncbi:MAG TPA: nitroreductase family protein [Thermodesulfobacteriota bacterium]|jgi:nitroreductase|nr:nitroreductase family protein [Thermodesulfobacteriota bacterium]
MRSGNPVIETIKTRRSVRQFKKEPVSDDLLNQILESGLWAPSGKNNQPWKFAVIRDPKLKESLSSLTHYHSIIRNASVCIAVFLDHSRVYDRTKDVLAVGASIQNMLLTIHSMGLGGVWLGEILKNKERVGELLGAETDLELMAVIALGYPDGRASRSDRDPLEEKVFLKK